MNTTQGSLTMLNLHTESPQVYWDGKPVAGVMNIQVQSDRNDSRVRLVVSKEADAQVCAEMVLNGIQVRSAE